MIKFLLMAALAAAGLVATPAALAASAEAAAPPTLTLSAAGEAKAPPDMAKLTIGVQTTAAAAGQAMTANAARAARVIAALRAAGVGGPDLQTAAISLSPQFVYEQDKPARLTGYQASNQLMASVRDIARLGPVVDAATAAGASEIGEITFGLVDPSAAENAAREAAVRALESKAALYARATGYRVSRLVALTEGAPESSGPRPMPMMAMRVAAAPTPVEAGQQTIHIDITGVFELTR